MNGLIRKITDEHFHNYISSFDLVLLTETWINEKHQINLDINKYKSFHLHGNKSPRTKKGRTSGGISVYYKKKLENYISVVETNNIGFLWVKLDKKLFSFSEDVFLCICYIPPPGSNVLNSNDLCFFEELENSIGKFSNQGKSFVTGDFNSRTGSLSDVIHHEHEIEFRDTHYFENIQNLPIRKNMDHVIDANGRKLISLCKSISHVITNGRTHSDAGIGQFTFCSSRGQSVTDYLLLSPCDIMHIHDFSIHEWSEYSDHAALCFSILILKEKHILKTENNARKNEDRIIWNKDKADDFKNLLQKEINSLSNLSINENVDVVSQVNCLSSFLYENALKIFGKKCKYGFNPKYKTRSSLWFDNNCKVAKEEFKKYRLNYNKNKSDENRKQFVNMRTKYNNIKKKAKFKYKVKIGRDLEQTAKTNPRSFWKELKKKHSKIEEVPPIHELQKYFNDLLSTNPNSTTDESHFSSNVIDDDSLDQPISDQELQKAVFHQKNNKACGPDNISAEIIKTSYNIIKEHLLNLFNYLFSNSIYPDNWSLGYIVPIFKGGDRAQASNYRGITLNNILAKIYSQLLFNRLSIWTQTNSKITDCQFGFQKGKSTIDCIFILHSIVAKTLSKGEKLYCIFIDYEKAFDKVNRTLLWNKLIKENVSTKMINAIKSMYKSVKSAVKVNMNTSETIISHEGVKQGDPSSSLLFMMFINDIIENMDTNLEGIFTLDEIKLLSTLYADDQTLFSTSPDSIKIMLENLVNYCQTNKLKINTKKTKIMVFEKRKSRLKHEFFIYNEKIEEVEEFNFLGVNLYKNGCWFRTQKNFSDKGSKSLFGLYSLLAQYEFSTQKKCELFDNLVLPVMHYASEIWGIHAGPDVDLILNKFCRKVLSVKKSTNLQAMYGELGRIPLSILRKYNIFKYWIKILNLNDDSIIKRIYEMLKTDANKNIKYDGLNWAFHIKTILNDLGLTNYWLNQDQQIIELPLIKQRLFDQYFQSWYSNINNSHRLTYYSMFKHEFKFENYLDYKVDKKLKICLTRFRLSSHDLEIEKGRHFNIPQINRLCTFCNMKTIESEYHFLLICPYFTDLRKEYLKPYYYTWPNLNKFENLMISGNKKTIFNLMKFIFRANTRRTAK